MGGEEDADEGVAGGEEGGEEVEIVTLEVEAVVEVGLDGEAVEEGGEGEGEEEVTGPKVPAVLLRIPHL